LGHHDPWISPSLKSGRGESSNLQYSCPNAYIWTSFATTDYAIRLSKNERAPLLHSTPSGRHFCVCQAEVIQTSVIEAGGAVNGRLMQTSPRLISLSLTGPRILASLLSKHHFLSAWVTNRVQEDGKLEVSHVNDCSSFTRQHGIFVVSVRWAWSFSVLQTDPTLILDSDPALRTCTKRRLIGCLL
uniref:Alpha-galactosidase n=1 Tax=Schistocephalus solidus TaxID=70667 RepID=A0A183SBB5_SCHSO